MKSEGSKVVCAFTKYLVTQTYILIENSDITHLIGRKYYSDKLCALSTIYKKPNTHNQLFLHS